MRRTRFGALVPLLLLVAVAAGCGRPAPATNGEPRSDEPAVAAGLERAFEVDTCRVEPGTLRSTLIASGSLMAPRTTEIGPEVGGRLARIHVEVGDTVAAGAPVFEIDAEPYEIAHQESLAGLELARAELAQAEQELERSERLARQSIVAEQEYDRILTQVAVSRARVQAAEARERSAADALERTVARAPYDSHVVARRLHEGAIVTVGAASIVLTLQERGVLEAILDVPEASRMPVRLGDPVTLFVEGAAEPLRSRIDAVNARVDPDTRTYEVRAPIDTSGVDEAALKSGSFVRAEITPAPRGESLLVHRSAVLLLDGRAYAFRLEGSEVEQVRVEVGRSGSERTEILSGLEPGDEVVIGEVLNRLADGARVRRRGQPATSGGCGA